MVEDNFMSTKKKHTGQETINDNTWSAAETWFLEACEDRSSKIECAIGDPSVSGVKSMNRVPEEENRAEVLRVVVGYTHFILLSVTSLSKHHSWSRDCDAEGVAHDWVARPVGGA